MYKIRYFLAMIQSFVATARNLIIERLLDLILARFTDTHAIISHVIIHMPYRTCTV